MPHLHWRCWTPCMVRQWNTCNTQLGWKPLRWSYAFCRVCRKPEDMNQVLCWTTKARVKGVAPVLYFCWAPPDSCVLFMSVRSYLSSVGAVCSHFEDDFCVLQCMWQLHRTCSLTITDMKLSVLCRKVIDTECRSRTEHTATLCGQKAAPHLSVFARKLNDNLLQSSLVFLPMMYVCMYVCIVPETVEEFLFSCAFCDVISIVAFDFCVMNWGAAYLL